MKKRNIVTNICSSALTYGGLIIFSIIVNKQILLEYGSETNGLTSSINQVFSYMALLEAGIGTATITALYKPLQENNSEEISNVLTASKQYYRTSVKWYFVCVVIISVVWPLMISTEIRYATIVGMILFQGIAGVLTFWYTSTASNYLNASGKNYINNHIDATGTLMTYTVKLIICSVSASIVFVSVGLIVVNGIKCLIYRYIINKHCSEYYSSKRKADVSILGQRRAFLIHEVSGVIFGGTDTILLSVFCSLKDASVYAIYAMVIGSLRTIVNHVFNGTSYVLGTAFAKDNDSYLKIHDVYNGIYIACVFALYTIAYLLIIPFISIYTAGITDANYVDKKVAVLFVIIELLSSCRIVDGQLIKIAGHAKKTISRTITEAIINLVVSVITVQFWGIYGVLTGTVVALLYRMNDIIWYTNRRILDRLPWKEYCCYIVNFVVFFCCMHIGNIVHIEAANYLQLIIIAIIVAICVFFVYIAVNLILYCRAIMKYRVDWRLKTHNESGERK